MFSFWSLSKDPEGVAGTIRVSHDPRKTGNIFSTIKDVDGKSWHLNGQVGRYVLARPAGFDIASSDSPTGTIPDLFVRHRSYIIEVVGNE